MSDRGFGDHASRNVVKNPLLSTAVIGVSLEDLTHNAVLLPAVPNQELITRQDTQTGTQTGSLRNPEQNRLDLSSGDSNSNIYRSQTLTNINPNPSNTQKNLDNNNIMDSRTTLSKASHNTEDDFDVNEYFARLHGTRYVSAPINSAVKEAENLATEENLEEINLNEPDKPVEEFQHSLTADIAQNFSQLPTVLPQVASAVFSSFSNMLSMKSREHTPDVVKPLPDYSEQVQRTQEIGVPLMSVPDVVKEVAPPPKKPPIGTPSNYRITTKKKMYAQIPGLKSADMMQNISTNQPIGNPSHFAPETQISDISTPMRIHDNVDVNTFEVTGSDRNVHTVTQFGANNNVPQFPSNYPEQNKSTTTVDDLNLSIEMINKRESIQTVTDPTALTIQPAPMSVIPPPPMFSNQLKTDQTNIRSVLPPSIARRVSANNPVIKPQAPLSTPMQNIFVPSVMGSHESVPSNNYPGDIQEKLEPMQQRQPYIPSTMNPAQENSDKSFISDPLMQPERYTESATNYSGIIQEQPNKSFVIDPKLPQPERYTASATNNPGITQTKPDTSFIIDPNVHMGTGNTKSKIIKPASYGSSKISIFVSKEIPQESILENLKGHSPIDIPQKILSPEDLVVKQLSQMNLDPPITNLADELLSEKLKKPTNLKSVPPPTFFNQSATDINSDRNVNEVQNIPTVNKSVFEPNITEPNKSIPEPPKMSSNNFRMTKKKPQYYSGPIEGVGSISNHVKPIVYSEPTNTFQGPLYTPQLPVQQLPGDSGIILSGATTDPLTTSLSNAGVYQQFETQPQTQNYGQQDYNTAFDLSRQTTEYYENQQESKGFGIIGSLKSKLSSIDLNKIQNSVTTFFDPAYNYTKMDTTNREQMYESFPLEKTAEIQDGNLEIYVPTVEPASQAFGYNYQLDGNTVSNSTGIQQVPYNYFPDQTSASSSDKPIYNAPECNLKETSPWAVELTYTGKNEDLKAVGTKINKNPTTQEKEAAKPNNDISITQIFTNPNIVPSNNNFEPFKTQVTGSNLCESSIFSDLKVQDNIPMQNLFTPMPAKIEDKASLIQFNTDETSTTKLSESFPIDSKQESSIELNKTEIKGNVGNVINPEVVSNLITPTLNEPQIPKWDNIGFKYFESASNLPSDSTFDSQATAIFNKEPAQTDLFVDSKAHQGFLFDQNAADFFDRPLSTENTVVETVLETVLKEEEIDHDISNCETCREVNKPVEKEAENLTDQLIENVIAPIQLSNPVEVPFTDNDSPDVIRADFEPNQCAEITHITEETIATIQEHAATDLMDDFNNSSAVHNNYGWLTDESPSSSNNALLEHDYSLQTDNVTSRLFQTNSLTVEDIPTNASDEIKAEYKNSFDEPLTVFPRQMSIPSAPPAEEDSKSDESGLDVHSIEQDATKDFPIYDDNVIEPSETDDDKIEFRERERSSEESIPGDTFTNRVERYKKMEETLEHSHEVFKTTDSSMYDAPTSTSPSTTIASYFDTGNYAVENFYRNSSSSHSVSNMNAAQSQHPMTIVRAPPGFETLYPKQFYIVPNENYTAFATPDVNSNKKPVVYVLPDSNVYIPKPESSLTYYVPSTETNETTNQPASTLIVESTTDTINVSEQNVTNTTEADTKLPDFATVFGTKNVDTEVIREPSSTSEIESTDTKTLDTNTTQAEPARVRDSPDVYDFSRLSSYFSSPSQTDPSKSFFELSQSENHYRQDNPTSTAICDRFNIPSETYDSSMNLIKDLTSTANIETIPKEQIVRTVNYFTILYDNDSFNHKKESIIDSIPIEVTNSDIHLETSNECNQVDIIETCKHCCSIENGIVNDINIDLNNLGINNVKIKQYMNKDSSELKNVNMEVKKETAGDRSFTVNFDNITIQDEKGENLAMMTEVLI
ncbi:PREDICTED: uncharacterized protein LOC106103765 [Papilio polytes]|uniref:uncharacterized protein LOC106103765 n=1 Tax=Papilio polytes TaxID=76194 RepID=UPI000676369C|nr:PREDICTED: uncharacterized protein LOC106103765 [Papilio polytes]